MVGLCQGGWQSAIYASIFPYDVSHLVIAGAPIDFSPGSSRLVDFVHRTPIAWFQSLVDMNGGIVPGEFMRDCFKAMHYIERYWCDSLDLWNDFWILDEWEREKAIERKRRFRNWYEHSCQAIPGDFFLQVVNMFRHNKLVKGEMEILGKRVDLSNIKCPITLLAGAKDDISPPEQLFAMSNFVGVPVTEYLVDAGHIGVFMGRKAIKDYWSKIFRGVIEND